MMRPSVPGPTGTEIGAPVLFTFMPRRSPSEEPSAMQRTTPSPSCCSTSKVSPFSASESPASSSIERFIDLWHRLARKLDVGHRTDALDDRSLSHVKSYSNLKFVSRARPVQTAAAPPTISDSSLVIAAWRFLL